MISVEDAQARLLALVQGFGSAASETVSIADSIGRILAADVIARRNQPPFPSAAMDGYAVRWEDIQHLPATLSVIGDSQAGNRFPGTVTHGKAVRILTGAPLPDGADSIVVQEDVTREGNQILIQGRPDRQGGHVRRTGLDCAAGDILAQRGAHISPARAGLIAAGAVTQVEVAQKTRVDLVLCGDELRLPGQPLGADQIVSTNGLLLAALLKQAGADVVGADNIIPDDLAALTAVIKNSDARLILSVGGASVGDRDYVQAAIVAAGGMIDFWKIAMRPGKPLMIATLDKTLIIGLPGNPVSAFVGAMLFALPAVRALQGAATPFPHTLTAQWAEAMPAGGPRADYLRAKLERMDGGLVVRAIPVQDSSMLSVLASADALAIRPAHAAPARAGDLAEIVPLIPWS